MSRRWVIAIAVCWMPLVACLRFKGKEPVKHGYSGIAQVVANSKHTCLLDVAGKVRCFGGDDSVRPPMKPAPGLALARIATARRFACGVTVRDGSVACWGSCVGRECDGLATKGFVDLALADDGGGCAWRADGSVDCWGDPADPLFAQPPATQRTNVRQLVFGTGWGLALHTDGTLGLWGAQPLVNDADLRRAVLSKKAFASIAGGGAAACAIDSSQHASCWETFDNKLPPDRDQPIAAIAFSNPNGADPACDLAGGSGQAAGWIRCTVNVKGEQLILPGTFQDLAVGDAHVCGRDTTGAVTCIGSDWAGAVSGRDPWP